MAQAVSEIPTVAAELGDDEQMRREGRGLAVPRPAPSRDARDVATIYKLLTFATFLALALVVAAGMIFWLLYRKPDLVIIDDTSGRRVVLNNREVATSPAASIQPHQLLDDDKTVVTKRFLSLIYNVDPQTHGRDVETALGMMFPGNAAKLSDLLTKGDGTPQSVTLSQLKQENWQAVWTAQSVTIDANDKYLVHVIGVQNVTRTVNGQEDHFTKQYSFRVKLVVDKWIAKEQNGNPRAERNFNCGFLILEYTGEQIQNPL